MIEIRKICFSIEEIRTFVSELDGYVWMAVDTKRGMMAVGDGFEEELKYELLKRKCLTYDVYGVGFDLVTGDIDYVSSINVRFADKGSTREVPFEKRERIETLVRYFFSELPIFKDEKKKPRYSKKVK